MYILIMEGGEVGTVENITQDDFGSCADSMVTIINPRDCTIYDPDVEKFVSMEKF